jgi:RHS repeat-associated protein
MYARDSLTRVTRIVETVGPAVDTLTFSYDSVGRLALVNRNGGLQTSYEYDRNGNRVRVTTPNGSLVSTHDAQDRVVSSGTALYGYSPDGERRYRAVGSDTTLYQYSAAGELLAVRLPNDTLVEYVADAQGRRIGKRVNGVMVREWLYRDALAPIVELDGQGQLVSRFVYGLRPNVPEYMLRDGRTYRFVTDRLGSVRLVVDVETGAIAQRIDYDAFGQIISDSHPGFQPFGFAGGMYDILTGLTRFGSRDYDAVTGSWTSRDPLLFQGGASNLYAYADSDPINALDPSGFYDLEELQVTQAENNTIEDSQMAGFRDRLKNLHKFVCNVAAKATRYSERAYAILDFDHDHHIGPKKIWPNSPTMGVYGLWHITDLHPLLGVALKINGLWGLNSTSWETASPAQKKLAAEVILKATEVFDRACLSNDPTYTPIAPTLREFFDNNL